MKRNILILSLMLLSFGGMAKAQETSAADAVAQDTTTRLWTLEDCLSYALEHNIQVGISKISQLSGEEDIAHAKAQLFPSLSGSVSQNFTNYPSSDAETNNIYSGSYGLSSSLSLFDGGKRLNALKQSRLTDETNKLSVTKSENDIRISIIQAYMQILYAKESVQTNANTLEVSKEQLDRSRAMLEVGSISKVDYAQMESQYSSDKYKLIVSQTALDNYKLQLKQLLELDIMEDIEVATPELSENAVMTPLPDKETVYNTSLSVMPEVRMSEIDKEIAELDVKSAKAGYFPSLSLNASVGTGNTNNSNLSFGDQLKTRFNESIGVSLSIPIFSNRDNKTTLNKAKLASITSDLNLQNTKKQLLSTVEGLYLDAVSAQSQYPAALESSKALEETFNLTQEQYYVGMKNTLELLTAKNNYLNAQQELLQAKYTAIMSIQILNIYMDKPVSLE